MNYHLNTILLDYADQRKLDKVKCCLQCGASINTKDLLGKTCLMNFVISDEIEWVKFFVEQGADVNAQDNIGDSVFLKAVEISGYNQELLRYLLDHGADHAIKNDFDKTAMSIAIQRNDTETILLIQQHIDLLKAQHEKDELIVLMDSEQASLASELRF